MTDWVGVTKIHVQVLGEFYGCSGSIFSMGVSL